MTQSIGEVARAAQAAYEALEGWSAAQTITAGAIRAEAQVRTARPGQITVEYRTYEDPLSEFEERYVGGPEYLGDELLGLQFVHDTRGTWIYDPKSDVAVHKPGKTLYCPLRGIDALGELSFLRNLTHDFLLRDAGTEEISGRSARLIGLKPKVRQRSLLLKEELFPVSRATIALDEETRFPLRIVLYPAEPSPLFYLIGPSTPVTIEYRTPRLDPPDPARFTFTPEESTRVFEEKTLTQETLSKRLPFRFPLDPFSDLGYSLHRGRATLTANRAGDRAYALLTLTPAQDEDTGDGSRALSLRIGNYLSRNMSRRRALLAEKGEAIELESVKARLLDRAALLADELPQSLDRTILEVGWERDGVHAFLLGDGVNREELLNIASTLLTTNEAPEVPEPEETEEGSAG